MSNNSFFGEGRLPGDEANPQTWMTEWDKVSSAAIEPARSQVEEQVDLVLKHADAAAITGWKKSAVEKQVERADGSMAAINYHSLEVTRRGGKPVVMSFPSAEQAAEAERIVRRIWEKANRNPDMSRDRGAKLQAS